MEIYSDHNFAQAIQLARQGKFLHSLQLLKKLQQIHPDDKVVLLKIAEVYEQLGKIESVISLVNEVGPGNFTDDFLLQFAQMYIRNSKCEESADLISMVDKTSFPEAYYLKGQANFTLGEYEIAIINFTDFIKNGKNSDLLGDAYQYIAECLIAQKNYDKALKYAEKAEGLTSLSPELYFLLAKIYYFKDMDYHAKEYINKAIKMNESNIEFKDLAGRILYKTGDYNKAEKFLRASIIINEKNFETLSLLGQSCLKQEKTQEAIEFFNKSLEINPEDIVAKKGILECGNKTGI